MIDHYNAFISYRHAIEDSAIAAEVQHMLERYKLPKAIQQKTGMTKIKRIFRDKEELPITSDLNDDISFALEHSDFLIVICSTRTKESIWVEREIRYFLETHTKKQVLTVLVDGEPYEVIPEILLFDDVEVTREDGTVEIVKEPIEPLSCDYRIPIKRARREELPRLAAALLGCSYDELVEREKQYRKRRLITWLSITGVLLAIVISYLVWSLLQIRKNYEMAQANYELAQQNYELAEENYRESQKNLAESQKNQSIFLANESLNLLQNNHRIDAILLAMAALPNAENDRPLVPEAEYALSQALAAYVPPSISNVDPAWNYETGSPIEKYRLSGNCLAAFDSSDILYVWNRKDHTLLWQIPLDDIVDIRFADDELLLVMTGKTFYAFRPESGSEPIWHYDAERYFRGDDVVLGDRLVYLITEEQQLVLLDQKTGALEKTLAIPSSLGDGVENAFVTKYTLSPEETHLGVIMSGYQMDYFLGCLNLETGEFARDKTVYPFLNRIYLPDEDHLMAAAHDDIMQTTSAIGSSIVVMPSDVNILCMDTDTMKTDWKAVFRSTQISMGSDFLCMPFDDGSGELANCIVFYLGNIADVYRLSDGKLLASYETTSSIIRVSDLDHNGTITFFTADGQMGNNTSNYDKDAVTLIKYFTDNLEDVKLGAGAYAHQRGASEIIYYGTDVYDDEIGYYDKEIEDGYIRQAMLTDHYLIITKDCQDEEATEIAILDQTEKKVLNRYKLECGSMDYRVIGERGGKALVLLMSADESGNRALKLLRIDPSTGETDEETVLETSFRSVQEKAGYGDGKLYMVDRIDTSESGLLVYDLDTKETRTYSFGEFGLTSLLGIQVSPDGQNAFFALEDRAFWFIGKSEELLPVNTDGILAFDGITAAAFAEDESCLVLADQDKMVAFGRDGKAVWTNDLNGVGPISMYIRKDVLMAALSDGMAYKYNLEDGAFLAKTAVIELNSSTTKYHVWYVDDQTGKVYLTLGRATTVLDLESWVTSAEMYLSFGYHPSSNTFAGYTYDLEKAYQPSWFRCYSAEELQEKAGKLLGETELSEQKKAIYGLK